MPKAKPPKKVYMLYVTANMGAIAAQEISTERGKSTKVLYPAFVGLRDDRNGFIFNSIAYVEGEFELFHNGALLGRSAMPKIMVPFYEEYLKKMQPQL